MGLFDIFGKKEPSFMIDAVVTPGSKAPSPVNIASEGTNVALHLSTMDHSRFVRGNTVIK